MSVPVMATACGPRTQRAVNAAGIAAQQTTNGGKGWFGQGQVGCDYQFRMPLSFWSPNVVIGAFSDYEFAGSGLRGTMAVPAAGIIGSENMPWTWAAGARAGFLVTPKFLTYFDGGYTQANFSGVNFQNCYYWCRNSISP